jgi:hypothetical protein
VTKIPVQIIPIDRLSGRRQTERLWISTGWSTQTGSFHSRSRVTPHPGHQHLGLPSLVNNHRENLLFKSPVCQPDPVFFHRTFGSSISHGLRNGSKINCPRSPSPPEMDLMSAQMIHNDLIATLSNEAVAYGTLTKDFRMAQFDPIKVP